MTENYAVITFLGIFCGACIGWGTKALPGENWQFFASIPVGKQEDGTWKAVNITWYGLLVAGANVLGALVFFTMTGAAGIPFSAALLLLAALLLVCVPASSLVARLVEKKTGTLTVGGAVFVGGLAVPFLLVLTNHLVGRPLGFVLPIPQTLAACAVSFLFGEGLGRLACLSYGCCYGKPVEEYGGILGRLFERTALVFRGGTKKIAYAAGLEGRRVVPIQPITMIAHVSVGMASLLLYAEGRFLAAYLTASVFAGVWRVYSETFRADFRGTGKISAYQVMSAISVCYAVGVTLFLQDDRTAPHPALVEGLLSLWSPGAVVVLFVIWFLMVLFAGVSTTTSSRIRFSLNEDKI